MSNVWRTKDGLVEGTQDLPVDKEWSIAGQLYLCPVDGCTNEEWVFTSQPRNPCCTDHPVQLRPTGLDPSDPDAVTSARRGLMAKVRGELADRRQQMADAVQARIAAAWKAAEDAGRTTALDMRGHVPSLVASAAAAGAVVYLRYTDGILPTAAAGLGLLTAGPVLAYGAAYPLIRLRDKQLRDKQLRDNPDDPPELPKNHARRLRGDARQIALGVGVTGAWAELVAVFGANLTTPPGVAVVLAGFLAGWAVNRSHWDRLWAFRRGIRDLARRRAEAAARRLEDEANRKPEPAAAPVVEGEDPNSALAVGRRIAGQWEQIGLSPNVPSGFQMRRTRIIPEETRQVTIPSADGKTTIPIGWEFAGVCEPGALVARPGMPAPLIAAELWLASMFERDPSTMSLVDRPVDDDGKARPNRFLVVLTDSAPLGAGVAWKGKAGVRRGSDGGIFVHAGRTLTGNDVEELIYQPGKPFGGLTVGTTGGGKSAGTILRILNALAAGIFPILDDPKQLVDYADFIGIFPIGVTQEHARLIVRALNAERQRRERHLSTLPMRDRHGRLRPAEPVWNPDRDGPPILAIFEEFHMRANDPYVMEPLTEQVRTQRVAAMGVDAITQGGGLADLNNSNLRALLNTTRLRLYRMADNLAQLAGYTGTYRLSQLPRIPGVCLDVTAEAPPLPLRAAYVTRADVEGSVFDQLYAPDMTPVLTAPTLPPETIEVFREYGLMDLWELGKGPNGLSNLLNTGHTTNYAPLPASTKPGALLAADVILAIALVTPGCSRADIDTSKAWTTASSRPVPSTISRAVKKLTTDGLLTVDGDAHTTTNKDLIRAVDAATALFGEPTALIAATRLFGPKREEEEDETQD